MVKRGAMGFWVSRKELCHEAVDADLQLCASAAEHRQRGALWVLPVVKRGTMGLVVVRKECVMNRLVLMWQYARVLLSTSSTVLFMYYPF
jgi:hypothetical protein